MIVNVDSLGILIKCDFFSLLYIFMSHKNFVQWACMTFTARETKTLVKLESWQQTAKGLMISDMSLTLES